MLEKALFSSNAYKRLFAAFLTLLVILILNSFLERSLSQHQNVLQSSNSEFYIKDEVELKRLKPLILNFLPFYSEGSVERILEKKPRFVSQYAQYLLAQLNSINTRKQSEKLEDLIAYGKLAHKQNDSYVNGNKNIRLLKTIFCETELFSFLKSLAFFDFGYVKQQPQNKIVPYALKKLGQSIPLIVFSLVFTFVSGHLIGMYLVLKENKWVGQILNYTLILVYAIPIYLMIPLLIEKIALPLNWPIHGLHYSHLYHFILPFIAMSYGGLTIYARLHKSLYQQIFTRDYLWTFKTLGLSRRNLLFTFCLREALTICIPMMFNAIGVFLNTLIVVEVLFEINGFGYFFYHSILQRDSNSILFCIILTSFISMLGYFLADVATYLLDPRLKHAHS